MLIGGRWVAGTVSRPWTFAFQLWKERRDKRRGIEIPYLTWVSVYQPRMCSGAPRVVLYSPSIAASLTGWVVATSRAAQSPTSTCTGEARAAIVSGMASAVRSYLLQRPRNRGTA